MDAFREPNQSNTDKLKVLVLEDETEIREMILTSLEFDGFIGKGLPDGTDFMKQVDAFKPDLILMDQVMPGKHGQLLVEELRSNSVHYKIPLIMITGLDLEHHKVSALNLGADDYITKPFSSKELEARARALIRRSRLDKPEGAKKIIMGALTIDQTAHRVTCSGTEVALTLTEFKILAELALHVEQAVSRDRLRVKALGNLNVTDRTIDVHMASLRKKLGTISDSIETVRGIGYRMASLPQ